MKVSIIVPVYNSEKYLRDCLESLVNQTLEEIEIIAVDDASIDCSPKILAEYVKKYPGRLKVYTNLENKGQGYARNVGLSLAQGTYVGFVDSDDYVAPNMYEYLYNAAINFAYPEVLSTNLTFVRDSSYLNQVFPPRSKGNCYNVLEEPNRVLDESPSVGNKIFLKSALKDTKFLENCLWEDVAFSFSNLFNAKTIVTLTNMGYYYRKSATTGVSAQGFKFNPKLLDVFRVTDAITNATLKNNRYDSLKEYITFIQIAVVLQRCSEILNWQIPDTLKEQLIYDLYGLILEKYGDFRKLDWASLSSRVGINELHQINAIVNKFSDLNR